MDLSNGEIAQTENGDYVVACVVCGEAKPVMLYPHKANGRIVGWVFVCPEDQKHVVGREVVIAPQIPRGPITLGA